MAGFLLPIPVSSTLLEVACARPGRTPVAGILFGANMRKLTPKQRRFVEEYLVDLNATQAAIRAGYSRKTAASQGERLLRNVEVKAAIQAAMKARQERTEITQDRVIAELAKIAFGDQRRVMTWGPTGVKLRDSNELTGEEAAIVAEVSESVTATGGTLKLKTHDKVGALKLLGEHLGMFKQRVEVTGKDGGPIKHQRDVADLTDEELAAELAKYGIES